MRIIKVLFITKDIANKITFIKMLHELALRNNHKLIIEEMYNAKACIQEIIHKRNLPNLLIIEDHITLIAEIRVRSELDTLPIIALFNNYKEETRCKSLDVDYINSMNINPNNVWSMIEESQK